MVCALIVYGSLIRHADNRHRSEYVDRALLYAVSLFVYTRLPIEKVGNTYNAGFL